MPRDASGLHEEHREAQAVHRDGLDRRGAPEVGKIDTALAAAAYGLLRKLRREGRTTKDSPDAEFLLTTALEVLEEMGRERRHLPLPYDRKEVWRRLRRRLTLPSERFDRLLGDASVGGEDDVLTDLR